jgi:hypothetical protein
VKLDAHELWEFSGIPYEDFRNGGFLARNGSFEGAVGDISRNADSSGTRDICGRCRTKGWAIGANSLARKSNVLWDAVIKSSNLC